MESNKECKADPLEQLSILISYRNTLKNKLDTNKGGSLIEMNEMILEFSDELDDKKREKYIYAGCQTKP